MKFRLGLLVISAFAALGTLGVSSASASVEFGDTCSADESLSAPYTLTTLGAPPAGIALVAPTSGVITKVRMQLGVPLPLAIPEQVKLLRPAGGDNYLVTDQVTVQASTGQTVADARMQVQAGERLAMHGLPFSFGGTNYPGFEFFCESPGSGSVLGAVVGDVALGTTGTFMGGPEGRIPLVAVIEADADHDGYGDETQDRCPQSAALQTPCPVIVLDSYVLPGSSKAVVLVSSSVATRVTVSGTAKFPKAPKSAGTSAKAKLKGVSREASPGKLTRFTLNFPATLKSAVEALAPGKSITVKLQASATDVAGRKVTDKSQLKIVGQAASK